ncbi:hypothetical protein ACH42_10030 [Endozoicomonas sp. (ex Bugula neritina AB1)]|nr:hypothetical protein ACH42_10030 [Endozoicomonas sp. (ex Bugula neritina AB1)]
MASSFGFDLKALEMFVEVVKTGNMTTAAQRLNVTQSSISQSLTTLEKSLNTQLIDRSIRPMSVTSQGRYFYERSVRMLQEARLTSLMLREGKELNQPVRVALVDSLATSLAQPLMNTIKQHSTNWSISTGLSHIHAQSLLSHDVDIIISDDAVTESDELIRYPIFQEPLVLVTPGSYCYQKASLNRLANELEMARYPDQSLIGKSIQHHLRLLGVDPPKRFQLDNTSAILNMVAMGQCWCITTPLCLYQRKDRAQRNLSVYPLPAPLRFRELTLVSRRHDLWTLPSELASNSRSLLRDNIFPELIGWLPWLVDDLSIGLHRSDSYISLSNSMVS